MTSIVIAAHNEASVIGRCLDSLLADAQRDEFDVTVVANGCHDRTAVVARSRLGVRVVEIAVASKPAALNAGDAVAEGFPRIYLDADIVTDTDGARALRDAVLERGPTGSAPALAAVPRRNLELTDRPIPVRAYFAVNSRLPAFSSGLFGRGMIALSAQARGRFDRFPDMVADDLFLDSLFASSEKREVDAFATTVAVPMRTRDLVRRLVRVRRGNGAMRSAARAGDLHNMDVRAADRLAWLRQVVLPHPWLAPAAVMYVGISGLAAILARRGSGSNTSWGRDESTRIDPGQPTGASRGQSA
jgi:glycosyltransferase involved in cell wall biosynthesis